MSPSAAETPVAIAGLTAQEAAARLDRFGPHEPTATRRLSFLSDFLPPFKSPLVLILVIAAAASALLGGKADAGIIGVIVLLSGALGLTQTYRSERAVEQGLARFQPAHGANGRCLIG
jgi:Mg2+-importing ATPase